VTTDVCPVYYEEEWTWQIILIAFFVAAFAGVVIILIISGNRGKGTVGDQQEMKHTVTAVSPSDAPEINGHDDSNKPQVQTHENVTESDDKPTVVYATIEKSKTKKEQGDGSNETSVINGHNDSN